MTKGDEIRILRQLRPFEYVGASMGEQARLEGVPPSWGDVLTGVMMLRVDGLSDYES